ncbi:uncharacterized protein LOC127877905 isoform X2 [Dreissena polymorpha]|uniref:uncharacterized protein LOC127877905 isoform X2 n=1 Tax=Dreissena polymorpha TaxID=45954 RepID=UPI0022653FCC|nr:uncharacterized protein LOC127877905 isoform X2 [Dreissena polymorpha]
MMNHSKKRRSSILKIELDEESTRILGRNRRSSKRVSFADCYQVKEFQRDSPQRWKPDEHDENGDSSDPEVESSNSGKSSGVTGLDKLLSGAIQSPYQDVARYEIPEVALESFNILDANKTVYDSVELDLTETEKHSIYLGGLDGGPAGQPALETSTLLQSFRNGSSDRMKPMQIYSPSRARHNSKEEDPIGPAYFNFTPIQDKENIVPSQNFANMKYYDDDDDEHDMEDYNVSPVSSQLDWRSLLGRVFSDDEISMGQTLKRTSTDRAQTMMEEEPMEETVCIGKIVAFGKNRMDISDETVACPKHEYFNDGNWNNSGNTVHIEVPMEETKILGGIVSQLNQLEEFESMEETRLVGGILSKTNNQFEAMEETRPIVGILSKTNFQLDVMEETKSIGEILSKTNCQLDAMKEKRPVGGILCKTNFQLDAMEETRPVGEILSKTNNQLDATEVIRRVGGIMSKTNYHLDAMEETRPVDGILSKTNNQFEAMEETIPVGGILSKTNNQLETMEETRPVGGILSKTNYQLDAMEETQGVCEILSKTNYQLDAMEETRAVGGILGKTNYQFDAMEETRPVGKILSKTNNQFDAMEETMPVGGILSKTNNQLDAMEETRPVGKILSKTNYQLDAMEETRPVGGILSKSNNQLDAMEVIRHVGGIMSKTNYQLDAMEETRCVVGIMSKTNYQLDAMEETRPVGGILSKTNNQFEAMEETKPVGGILSKTNYQLETMEETRPVGGILSKTNYQLDAMEETRGVCGILSKTNYQLDAMEETKAVGGILGKTNYQLDAMEETRPVGEILSKTNNQLETMEETRPIGGILSKTNNHLETMEETSQVDKILSKTNNQLEAMEETRPVGGILSKTNNQLVTFDETSIENRIPGGSVKRTEIVQDNRPVVGQHGNLKSSVAKIDQTISMSNNANEKQAVETGPKDISIVKNVSLTCVVQNEDFIESLNTSKSLPLVINQEEIMEKDPLSAERSLMEKETCAEVGFDDVRTQDVTQSQTKLLKLKESLLAMKKITGPSIKAGNIKTPSKLSPSLQSYSVQNSIKKLYPTQPNAACSSPVRKRQRLSDPMDCMETVSDIAPLQEATLTTGIDDEEMPDVMNEDYLKDTRETGTLDTRSRGQSVQLQPESPCGPENMSAELADSSEDAHYSMANYTLQSGMGNKSYMAASFVVPEGPLSLDSFFELTKVKFDLPVKETRRSVFVPRIAQDDIAEVLYVEVAMKPEMDTFSRFKDSISEASNSLLEDIRLVEEGLEQSQPDIFAQVVNASPDQLAATKEELWELHRRCKVIARVNYKNQMTDLYAGFLRCLQTNVQVRARQKVAQMQAHVKTVDDLLERLKQGVIDIEQEEKSLEEKQSIMITLDRQIATEKESCVHLETELEALSLNTETSRQDCHELQAKEQCLQAIKGHFICSEWKLEDLREDVVVVSFHKGLIEMTIKFNSSAHDNLQDLQITSGPSSGNIGDRVFQSFALASIKTSNLQNQYPTRMKLPMLFHEVSSSLNELKRFCADLELVHFYKEIQFHDNELSVNMWSVYGAMRSFVTLKFIFNTLNPLRSPVQSTVCVKFGDICARDIEVQLGAVQPGHRYLTRLLDAVVSHNPCLSWKY